MAQISWKKNWNIVMFQTKFNKLKITKKYDTR